MPAKSETIHSNSILRLFKQNMMLKIMEIKNNEPGLAQKEVSKQLGYSYSTSNRYRDDINMDNHYNRNKNRKKSYKSNST